MTYEFIEIEIGPVDLVELSGTSQSRILQSAIGKILPYGDFRVDLVGARSIKAYRLPNEPNIILLSYSKYLQGTNSKDNTRGKIRSLVVVVEEKELVSTIRQNVDWVEKLFGKITQQIPSTSTAWIREDLTSLQVKSIENIQLPPETTSYLRRGGVGLAYSYYSPHEWVYMEEVVRSLVLLELRLTKKLPTFCTLATSTSEIVKIFAIPRFSVLSSGYDDIEIVESEQAYNKGTAIGRRLFYGLTSVILISVVIVGIFLLRSGDSTSAIDQTSTASIETQNSIVVETLTATALPTCAPHSIPAPVLPPTQTTPGLTHSETPVLVTTQPTSTLECRIVTLTPTETETPSPTHMSSPTSTSTHMP